MPEGGQFHIPQNKYRFGAFGPARRDQTPSHHFHLVCLRFFLFFFFFWLNPSAALTGKKKKSPFTAAVVPHKLFTLRSRLVGKKKGILQPGSALRARCRNICVFLKGLFTDVLQKPVTQLLGFLRAAIGGLQVVEPQAGGDMLSVSRYTEHVACKMQEGVELRAREPIDTGEIDRNQPSYRA